MNNILRYVQACIVEDSAYACALDAEEARLKAEGFRLVRGGPDPAAYADSEDMQDVPWEFTDHDTGEVLASGVGMDSYYAAGQDDWHHVDHVGDDIDIPSVDRGRLPRGLAEALYEWVMNDPDEAREWVKP